MSEFSYINDDSQMNMKIQNVMQYEFIILLDIINS